MRKSQDRGVKVLYSDPGYWPGHFGFCPNEKAWKAELSRLGHPDHPYPADSGGCCTSLHKDGKVCCIVTISERVSLGCDGVQIAALLAHEAVHVWQAMRKVMREEKPASEQEAYSVQHILQCLLTDYQKTRGKICAEGPVAKPKTKRGKNAQHLRKPRRRGHLSRRARKHGVGRR